MISHVVCKPVGQSSLLFENQNLGSPPLIERQNLLGLVNLYFWVQPPLLCRRNSARSPALILLPVKPSLLENQMLGKFQLESQLKIQKIADLPANLSSQ